MSAPVDVLAVMDAMTLSAERLTAGEAVTSCAATLEVAKRTRAAVAELIEADKDYDDALAAFAAGPFPNLTPDSMDEWADEWARVAQRADLQDRLESAKTRRAAALARVKGGAA